LKEINKLKKDLLREFVMKDLGPVKQILGMRISRDRSKDILRLSQEDYVHKVLNHFKIGDTKPRYTPLANHFKLTKEQSPKTNEERDYMPKVPYPFAVESLMYDMVCTRPDITFVVGAMAKFMVDPSKAY